MSIEAKCLYVIATPIGNLGDITYRAVEVLRGVDRVAAEDTRHSAKLLQHYGITVPLVSLHEHNERDRSESLVAQALAGESLALITDAGTPLISDPGYRLVLAAQRAGVRVIPLPGPCAAVAALSAAGLATDRFVFEGFLPSKAVARCKRLEQLAIESRTLIFYEAPHRIMECLQDMRDCLGAQRPAVIARELTKTFETIHKGVLEELCQWLEQDSNQQRGEFVVLVGGLEAGEENAAEAQRILALLMKELPLKQAARLAAEITGEKKNRLYEMGLADKQ